MEARRTWNERERLTRQRVWKFRGGAARSLRHCATRERFQTTALYIALPEHHRATFRTFLCPHKLTFTDSFSPSRFRGRLAGPPLLVTAVHLPRRMATADWLVRCVHIFDDR